MPRRRDALRHLQALTEAGATPAQRLVTLVVLAHANDENEAAVSAKAIGELCQYGTRHVQQTLAELQQSGILVKLGSVGNTNRYRVETTNPRPLTCERALADVTIEDVLDLLRHHASIMGLEAPKYIPAPETRRAVSEAVAAYSKAKCEIAHYGHLYRVNNYPEQAKYKTFRFCYPIDRGRLNREWFEGLISDGVDLQRQAKQAKLKQARERAEAEVRRKERDRCRSDEGRKEAQQKAREILRQLGGKPGCGLGTPSVGRTRGPARLGDVLSVGNGPAVQRAAASAEPPSGSSDD